MRDALIARLKGVDTVVYDTHFLPEEYARFPHYGHSTPDQALELCAQAGVRRLVLYHHAPSHSDDQMDDIAAAYLAKGAPLGIEVLTSFEGMSIPIGPDPRSGDDLVEEPTRPGTGVQNVVTPEST